MGENFRRLWKNRNYRKLLCAGVINRFGDSVDALAMSWLMYSISQSASLTALNFALNFLPTVVLQPLCGAWVEKRDLKKTMVAADLCRAGLIGAVAALALLGQARSWMLLVFTVLISTVEAFRVPCQAAVIPLVLPPEEYSAGTSLSGSLSSVAQLIGTALAGGVVALWGVSAGLWIDTACFLGSAALLGALVLPRRESAADAIPGVWAELQEGFFYVRRRPALWMLCLVALLINALMAPFSSLEAAMAARLFEKGPEVLSLIGAAVTLGNILGSLLYPRAEERIGPRSLLLLCYGMVAIFYGTCLLAGALRQKALLFYPLIGLVPFALGISIAWINIFASVMMLRSVAEGFLSRVSAITGALCALGMPASSFLVSAAAARISVGGIFAAAAVLTALTTLALSRSRTLRAIAEEERHRDAAGPG